MKNIKITNKKKFLQAIIKIMLSINAIILIIQILKEVL